MKVSILTVFPPKLKPLAPPVLQIPVLCSLRLEPWCHSSLREGEENLCPDWSMFSAAVLIFREGNQSQRHSVLLLDVQRILCSQGNHLR